MEDKKTTNAPYATTNDPYARYRHITFHYLSYYLHDFFQSHHIKHGAVTSESDFGGNTLSLLLNGKDMHFNCYLRLLTVMGEYCNSNDEYMDFIMEFMQRAIIEIWIIWEEEPVDWMLEVWKKMQKEKDKYSTENA